MACIQRRREFLLFGEKREGWFYRGMVSLIQEGAFLIRAPSDRFPPRDSTLDPPHVRCRDPYNYSTDIGKRSSISKRLIPKVGSDRFSFFITKTFLPHLLPSREILNGVCMPGARIN